MKLLRISIIRAFAALLVGVLLLKYGCNVLKGLTIALGIMFLIAGLVSLIGWINSRRQKVELRAYDNGEQGQEDAKQPMFPIVGLGSLLLGCILSLTQTDDFLVWALYLVGAVLILGARHRAMNIVSARKMEPVGAWMWVLPAVINAASAYVMVKEVLPQDGAVTDPAPSSLATVILGVAALVYALGEVVFSVVFYNVKRRFDKTQSQVRRASPAEKNGIETAVTLP